MQWSLGLCIFPFWVVITDAKAETTVLWPPHEKSWLTGKDWCWEGLGAGGKGDDRGWDGWMASPTRWTWVWVHSWSWWWTGKPGVLWFMGSQRDTTERLNWTELNIFMCIKISCIFSGESTKLTYFVTWNSDMYRGVCINEKNQRSSPSQCFFHVVFQFSIHLAILCSVILQTTFLRFLFYLFSY